MFDDALTFLTAEGESVLDEWVPGFKHPVQGWLQGLPTPAARGVHRRRRVAGTSPPAEYSSRLKRFGAYTSSSWRNAHGVRTGGVSVRKLCDVSVSRDQIVSRRDAGKPNQVSLVWVGCESDLKRRVVEERRCQPQGRDKRNCVVCAEPATKSLAVEDV